MAHDFRDVDRVFRRDVKKFGVAGAIAGVVHNGESHIRPIGLRNVKTGAKVTENTRFCIASMTKSITSMSVALCVDDGGLDWDQPVKGILPGFKMHDPVATERLTVRDFLSHRSGLPRHDNAWATSLADRAGMLRKLRHLPFSADIRTIYQYCNLGYLVSACIVEQISGLTWEDFVRERILQPAGLAARQWSEKHPKSEVFSFGYYKSDNGFREGRGRPGPPKRGSSAMAPAGAMLFTMEEMLRWLTIHMNRGVIDGRRVFPEELFDEMHKPHICIPRQPNDPRLHTAYCLGWRFLPYRGHRRLEHGGTLGGFRGHMAFMPGLSICVSVFSNTHCDLPPRAIDNIVDCLMGESSPLPSPPRDKPESKPAESEDAAEPVGKPRALSNYEGLFGHAGYGEMTIRKKRKKDLLTIGFDAFDADAKRVAGDVFEIRMPGHGKKYRAEFRANRDNRITSVKIPLEPTVDPIVFLRRKK